MQHIISTKENFMHHLSTLPVVATQPLHDGPALPPADFKDIPYSPDVLLPVQLDPAIMAQDKYNRALKQGFDDYFEGMYTWNEDETDLLFENHFYTLHGIQTFVIQNAFPDRSFPYPPSLSFRCGFIVGWLSALALTDRELALQGLHLLVELTPYVSAFLVAVPDVHRGPAGRRDARGFTLDSSGWPMDM